MPGKILKPLLALNVIYVFALVTLEPKYGAPIMIIAGACVSVVNILAWQASMRVPRRP